MKIERQILLEKLKQVEIGVGDDTAITEQMNHIIFTKEYLFSFNGQIYASVPFDTDFEGSVKFKEFKKTLEQIKEKEIEIFAKDNQLLLQTKSVKAGFVLLATSEMEEIVKKLEDEISADAFKDIPKTFREGIRLCAVSSSSDKTSGILSALKIEDNIIVGCDNTKLSLFELDDGLSEFMADAEILSVVAKKEITGILLTENWIHFNTKNDEIFSTLKLKGKFPDFETLLEDSNFVEKTEIETKFIMELTGITTCIAETVEEKKIEIILEGKEAICKCKDELRWVNKKMELENEVKNKIQIKINAGILSQILPSFSGKTIELSLSKNKNMLRMKHEKHTQILMLLVDA